MSGRENHPSSQPASSRATPNILFLTTRMWNPGDDFILFGLINLLEPLIGRFNPVVYNRNPELHGLRINFDKAIALQDASGRLNVNIYRTVSRFLHQLDNSWRPHIDLKRFDLVVFAGTPEWLGPMVEPLVSRLVKSDVPVMYLGIGCFDNNAQLRLNQLPGQDRELLSRSRLTIVRDATTRDILSPLRCEQLPCPALFATGESQPRKALARIALSTQSSGPGVGQRIDPPALGYCRELFHALRETFDCELVLHYINELEDLSDLCATGMSVRYSYDAKDYIRIYNDYDLAVTTRVHGAGLCASLGIPAYVVAHSARSDTVSGFLARSVKPGEVSAQTVVDEIRSLDIAALSKQLIDHKQRAYAQWQDLLEPALEKIGLATDRRQAA